MSLVDNCSAKLGHKSVNDIDAIPRHRSRGATGAVGATLSHTGTPPILNLDLKFTPQLQIHLALLKHVGAITRILFSLIRKRSGIELPVIWEKI